MSGALVPQRESAGQSDSASAVNGSTLGFMGCLLQSTDPVAPQVARLRQSHELLSSAWCFETGEALTTDPGEFDIADFDLRVTREGFSPAYDEEHDAFQGKLKCLEERAAPRSAQMPLASADG